MACGQDSKLYPPAVEEPIWAHQQGICASTHKCCESFVDLVNGAGVENPDLQPNGVRRRIHVSNDTVGPLGIGRVDEQGNATCSGHKLMQNAESFCQQLANDEIEPGRISARPCEARDKTKFDWIVSDTEHDRDGRGGLFGRKRRGGATRHCDHIHSAADQIGGQSRQSIIMTVRRSIFQHYVLAFHVAGFGKTLQKWSQVLLAIDRRGGASIKDSNHRHRRLLRARRHRPRRAPPSPAMNSRRLMAPPKAQAWSA